MDDLYKKCIEVWGVNKQFEMVSEEFGELLTAINHYKRKRVGLEKVMEETADCYLIINQIASLDEALFNKFLGEKRAKIEEKLKNKGL